MRVFELKGNVRAGKGKRFKAGEHVTEEDLPIEMLEAKAAKGDAQEVLTEEKAEAIAEEIAARREGREAAASGATAADLVPLLKDLAEPPTVNALQAAAKEAGLSVKVNSKLRDEAWQLAHPPGE